MNISEIKKEFPIFSNKVQNNEGNQLINSHNLFLSNAYKQKTSSHLTERINLVWFTLIINN